jgi:hypothetical protein
VRKAATSKTDANSAVWGAIVANLDTASVAPPPSTTVVRFVKFLEVRSGDMKRISPTPAIIDNVAIAKGDVQQINVFPNPYYGVNPQETSKYVRFVTFSHLPQRATIRIFNLAGVMVRKIDRLSSSQFEQWDLKNQDGLPVGSGLYIVHIDMPDLGTTKILKVAIVQEQQILDRFLRR